MSSQPRAGKLAQDVTVSWSDGTHFNGFLLAGLVPPTDAESDDWASLSFGNSYPSFTLPVWARLPIVDGRYNASVALFYNEDITPPGSEYIAYYYDATGRQIAGPTDQFTVSSATFTPPSLTLTAPSGTGTPPLPN